MIRFPSKPFSLPGFPTIERALNHFRTAVEGFVRDVNRCPLIEGNMLTEIELSTSWKYFNHQLGRKPRGYIIVHRSLRYLINESKEDRTDKVIRFRCDGNMVADVWVF